MMDLGSSPFEALVVRLAAGTLLAAATWLTVIAVALLVEVVSRGRLAAARRVGCPASVRRVVLAACGVAVVAGTATAPSYATGHRDTLGGLPLPDRPTGSETAAVHRPVHVVRPGECLWSIAAARAPNDPARLAARLYALNRHTIGGDPDLIHPGQRLRLPPAPTDPHHPSDEETP